MNVLVRVEMRRVATEKAAELRDLMSNLSFNCGFVIGIHDLVEQFPFTIAEHPFAKVHVQADADPGASFSVSCGFRCAGPADHQAGAGENPVFGAFDNAAIDSRTKAEVICVYDEEAGHE